MLSDPNSSLTRRHIRFCVWAVPRVQVWASVQQDVSPFVAPCDTLKLQLRRTRWRVSHASHMMPSCSFHVTQDWSRPQPWRQMCFIQDNCELLARFQCREPVTDVACCTIAQYWCTILHRGRKNYFTRIYLFIYLFLTIWCISNTRMTNAVKHLTG